MIEDDNTHTHFALTSGTVVSQYRIIEKIGAGGMGEVYLAEDTKLKRNIVLKFLPVLLCQDPELRARFLREAQATARLDHPNIVTVYEVNEHQGRTYIAMSLIDGVTLKEHCGGHRLTIEETINVVLQVARGLLAAHENGIIHRDIKPSNIILDKKGRVRIVDFGLATLSGSDDVTQTGSTMGTVGYMSPEQIKGEKTCAASDLFSLGVLFFEIICGERPFLGDNQAAVMNNIVNQPHRSVLSLRSDAPSDLAKVIDKLLAKVTEVRYQSAAELIDDLGLILDHKHVSIPPTISGPESMPSIAVLPFANMSSDPDNEYFSDGITEEIISSLSRLKNLHVAARTSSFYFKNKSVEIREIGDKLQVEKVLEGSVRKMGNKLRISVQLINVADGYHIWSEKYDRTMDDVFAIQDEIAGSITEKLELTLTHSEKSALIKHGTDDMQAYDLYLRGRFYWEQRGFELITALAHFQKAIEIDPNYARAYVALGDAYNMMGLYGLDEPIKAIPNAREAARKALELEPNLAEAHTTLAMSTLLLDRDWAQAKELFERCNELNQRYAQNRYWYSFWYIYVYEGKTEEALAEAQRGIEIDPLAALPLVHYALILWMERRNDEVIEIMKVIQERDPIAYRAYWWVVAFCYADKGEYELALAASPTMEESMNRHDWSVAFHGHVLAVAGRTDDAKRLQGELDRRAKTKYISNFSRSVIPISLGDIETTLDILKSTPETRDCAVILTSRWHMFSPIYENAQYKKLMAEEKLKTV